jgi:transcriptional regulator with XRE-family HTH domain
MMFNHVDADDESYGRMVRAVLRARERSERERRRVDAQDEQRKRALGYLIERMRNEARMSRAGLAKAIGSTQSSVSRWEAGTQLPSLHSLNLIAQVTGFDLLVGARGRGDEIDGSVNGRSIDPDMLVMGYLRDEGPMAELWLVANGVI